MKMYGGQSNALRPNMVCLVRAWLSAVVWTQLLLTKVSVGPKKDSPDGRRQTVFQRFCRRPGPGFKILLNSLNPQTKDANKHIFCTVSTPQKPRAINAWFFVGQLTDFGVYMNTC